MIDSIIEDWKRKLPDKTLDEYDNWRTDILDHLEFQLQKRGWILDEIVVDTTEQKEETNEN